MGPVLLHAMKGATVDHKLSVLVQMNLDDRSVRLIITGCVTEANQHVLYPLIHRARALAPPVTVSVDLTGGKHVEATAVDLLRWAVDHDEPAPGLGPVQILAPTQLPGSPVRTGPDHQPPETRQIAAGMSRAPVPVVDREITASAHPRADGGIPA